MPVTTPESVLEFWFSDRVRALWFAKSVAFDAEIRDTFGDTWRTACAGGCTQWEATCDGALALVVVLDQFPRNMFRDGPRSFESDPIALKVAKRAIDAGLDKELDPTRRRFLFMPFEHSETLDDQIRCCELFSQPGMAGLEWAEKHKAIIERFGRFPHRNEILGRESTAEEIEFLKGPGSSF